MLGGLEQLKAEKDAFLNAWRYQLTRLWDEVEQGMVITTGESAAEIQ